MEIERKFLVNKVLWLQAKPPGSSIAIHQAYLSADPKCTVRIRIADTHAKITIKGATRGISREEFEYSIPFSDGMEIIRLAETPVIVKRRYEIIHKGYKWEVDEFSGYNDGLVMAEVELESEEENPEWPEWIDREVSGDPRYFNLQLAINPIKNWQ